MDETKVSTAYQLDPDRKVAEVINAYPFLLDFLPKLSPGIPNSRIRLREKQWQAESRFERQQR